MATTAVDSAMDPGSHLQAAGINTDAAALASPAMFSVAELQEKYDAERDKRMRPDGLDQYVFLDKTTDPQLRAFSDDPWLDERSDLATLHDGQSIKHLVLGAGFGGLQAGVALVKAGVLPEDIYVVDAAGGWGGAWYFNRYPGVTCDIESYCYLPLLHETGYMPKHKYSYGYEIRAYVNSLASQYHLDRNAMFRTKINSATWDDSTKQWVVIMTKQTTNGAPVNLTIRTRFFHHFAGVHVHQKLPSIPGIASFSGQQFHIARWNYNVTGGSQENPTLNKLRDKRVAVVGTGASGIQVVPELAKHAKELYVVQRTPASVDTRGQRPTDAATWSDISRDPNWWRLRNINLTNQLSGKLGPDEPRLVDDECARVTTYRVVFGGEPRVITPDMIPEFTRELQEEDAPRMNRIRQMLADTVHDPEVAAKLTPWYTSWCKRPAFHDDYWATFNLPNVHLVDTDGKGVSEVTPTGIRANGRQVDVDVIVWATGYRGPLTGWTEERSGMTITGRDGRRFDAKWNEAVSTLHGSMTEGFPNLFLMGVWQGGMTLSWSWVVDCMAQHAAYIATTAEKKAEQSGKGQGGFSVEPTKEAEEAWSMEILKRAGAGAAMGGCTPNYFNDEGGIDRLPMEEKMKKARSSMYGGGFEEYRKIVEDWREEGNLKGMKVEITGT